jgi:3-oxoadipate CoA-transferase beta subunit
VTRIYTNFALIEVTPQGFVVQRIADDIDFNTLQKLTGATLHLSPTCQPYRPHVNASDDALSVKS